VEEKARREAAEKASRQAEEEARLENEALRRKESQERAQKEAEVQRLKEAQEHRKRDEIERLAAAEKANLQAVQKVHLQAGAKQPQAATQSRGIEQSKARQEKVQPAIREEGTQRSSIWIALALLGVVMICLVALGIINVLPSQISSPVQPVAASTPAAASTKVTIAWVSTVDRMELVYIPAGDFLMGCDRAHNGGYSCYEDELPLHTVYLDAYYIDKTEVTNAQYALCVTVGACEQPNNTSSLKRSPYYGESSYDNYPVINVSWDDASKYCKWAGRELPTEAQWEKAARGESVRAYPWGDDEPTCDWVNGEVGGKDCKGNTTAVGSYPDGASPFGVLDMAGNVWEWVSDWYSTTYYSSLERFINPVGPNTGTYRVIRGGSFYYGSGLRTANRYYDYPGGRYLVIGFRCAAPPAP